MKVVVMWNEYPNGRSNVSQLQLSITALANHPESFHEFVEKKFNEEHEAYKVMLTDLSTEVDLIKPLLSSITNEYARKDLTAYLATLEHKFTMLKAERFRPNIEVIENPRKRTFCGIPFCEANSEKINEGRIITVPGGFGRPTVIYTILLLELPDPEINPHPEV